MVRKSTRAAALKASERTKRESPRKTRRRKSVSKSDSDEEVALSTLKQQQQQPEGEPEKGSSDNESDVEAKKPLKKRTRSMAVSEAKNKQKVSKKDSKKNNSEQDDNKSEEVIEEGKGKSITRSDDGVNPETQSETVQVTEESPSEPNDVNQEIDDELSKNGMEIDVNICQTLVAEMTSDSQSSEVVAEETSEVIVTERADVEKDAEKENEQTPAQPASENTEEKETIERESSDVNEETKVETEAQPVRSKRIRLTRLTRDTTSVSLTPKETEQDKSTDNNEVPLKSPVKPSEEEPEVLKEQQEWTSSYEAPNKESEEDKIESREEQPTRKKITLKRATLEEPSDKKTNNLKRSSSQQEQIEEKKASDDNIVIHKRRRRSTTVSESEVKPQRVKPTKVVKLVRVLPEAFHESQSPGQEEEKELTKKHKWNRSKGFYTIIDTVKLVSLKEICPAIDLLKDSDVDLELTTKADKPKRKTFMELEEEEMENIEAELNAEPDEEESQPKERKISIVDDMASKLKPPPSPATREPSDVLYITNLVRPFTVKQLRELLERTGKIKDEGFWTDRIKSKCYVQYQSIEEAEVTRNALHGVHWPIGNGKKLVIDYATVEDLENAKNPPVVVPKIEKENTVPEAPSQQDETQDVRAVFWEENKGSPKRGRSQSESMEHKRSHRSYTPEEHRPKKLQKLEEQTPPKAMDDLFLKTKATPSIYWQPLSPEEIAQKQQQRQARLEENKRRMEEIRSSGRGGGGGPRDRRDRTFRRR